jgi:hypothetical protein
MPNELTVDQVRALAADAGMERFTDEHLEQLTRATNMARARRASLKIEKLTPADEPAHVFSVEDTR